MEKMGEMEEIGEMEWDSTTDVPTKWIAMEREIKHKTESELDGNGTNVRAYALCISLYRCMCVRL